MGDFAIWWLSQEDYETLGDDPPFSTHWYVWAEYRSRRGRSGRGRLWVSLELGLPRDFEIEWPDTHLAKWLAGFQDEYGAWHGGYGGIVIRAGDVPELAVLPGLITDLELRYFDLKRTITE